MGFAIAWVSCMGKRKRKREYREENITERDEKIADREREWEREKKREFEVQLNFTALETCCGACDMAVRDQPRTRKNGYFHETDETVRWHTTAKQCVERAREWRGTCTSSRRACSAPTRSVFEEISADRGKETSAPRRRTRIEIV